MFSWSEARDGLNSAKMFKRFTSVTSNLFCSFLRGHRSSLRCEWGVRVGEARPVVGPEHPAVQRQQAAGAVVQPAGRERVKEVGVEARRPAAVLAGPAVEAVVSLAALRQAGPGKKHPQSRCYAPRRSCCRCRPVHPPRRERLYPWPGRRAVAAPAKARAPRRFRCEAVVPAACPPDRPGTAKCGWSRQQSFLASERAVWQAEAPGPSLIMLRP